MKNIIVVLFCLFTVKIYSYDFPIKNPFSATIVGSSTLMTSGVSEDIPIKTYEVTLKDPKTIPDMFWYDKNFKFSLVRQDKEAPLVFVLAGTGSDYKSLRVVYFERILYDAGYNVISISSPMSSQFLISASSTDTPGLLINDGKDIYNAMKVAYEKVKDKIKVSDFYIMGYSLGAANSAVVSYLDEKDKFFNFKRVFMINPPVDLYYSATKLDQYLNEYTKGNPLEIEKLIQNSINKIKGNLKNEYTTVNTETLYNVVKGNYLTDAEKKAYIGLAFRLSSIDLNFITDVLTKSYVYTKPNDDFGKFANMYPYFKKVNFATFEDYINRIGYPYYKKEISNFSMNDLIKESNLNIIENYLKHSNKIAAVTNEDELILSKADLKFLKDTFGKRIIIFPYGGHCGNMFYKENVDIMLNFLKTGELKYEK